MASFTLVEGTNNPVHPADNGPNTEAGLAQKLVNDHMRTTKNGLTVVYVYDSVARTLTCTFSGTAS